MLDGYVTYEELKIITGYSEKFLNKLIVKGLKFHEADLQPERITHKLKECLFSLKEVESWLRIHIF